MTHTHTHRDLILRLAHDERNPYNTLCIETGSVSGVKEKQCRSENTKLSTIKAQEQEREGFISGSPSMDKTFKRGLNENAIEGRLS